MSKFKDFLPANVRSKFGNISVPLVNGIALIKTAKKYNAMIMATNCRCKLPVEGIARASKSTGAPVLYEIARSELGYTEFTPDSFVEYIIEVNQEIGNTEVPFGIHGDHITVKNMEDDKAGADALIKSELKAGFTSFAIDASIMENELNLKVTTELAKQIQEAGLCLEVELGEIGAKKGTEEGFTDPKEARWFIGELSANGVHPQLLAINNGSIHGTYFGTAKEGIQLDLTKRSTIIFKNGIWISPSTASPALHWKKSINLSIMGFVRVMWEPCGKTSALDRPWTSTTMPLPHRTRDTSTEITAGFLRNFGNECGNGPWRRETPEGTSRRQIKSFPRT